MATQKISTITKLFGPSILRYKIRDCTSLIRYATVCPDLRAYNELAIISPGVFKIPQKPLEMDIRFLDSSPFEKKKQTVVALHGSPGYCQHFEKMVNDFHESTEDVRFISLSLPDFQHTRENGYFWHTVPEKVNFIRQFLYDFKIDTIDCFVVHSFGVQAAVALLNKPENLNIKSICMFAPQPFWDTEKYNNKKRARKFFMFNNKLWYRLLDLVDIKDSHDQPAVFQNTNEVLLFYSLLYDQTAIDFERYFRYMIKSTNTPISVMYGKREKVVSEESIAKFNTILGIRNDQIVHLDAKIHTENDVMDSGKRVNSYLVDGAGHLVHMKTHKMAKRMLINLLARV